MNLYPEKSRTRRKFLLGSLAGGLTWSCAAAGAPGSNASRKPKQLDYRLELLTAAKLFDGKRSFAHARVGAIPDAGQDGRPRVIITMSELQLTGSDVYKAFYTTRSDDLGQSWTEPERSATMSPLWEEIAGRKVPVAAADFTPGFHAATGKLLGTGHTVVYTADWKVKRPRPRDTIYSVYDPHKNNWVAWKRLQMPDPDYFSYCGASSTQRWDEADGTILLPMHFNPPGKNAHVMVTRCRFEGKTLSYLEHGDEIGIGPTRGLYEPSLARFDGRYFLTIRNDLCGYVATSDDGLHYEPYQPWRFDDGEKLGNYNTQQHWVVHRDGLFLVYTRRGADNDHVFRHRAPLFIARVDPDKPCVIRDTERILVPERGARLGNFGVTNVTPEETWVTAAEWMQPRGAEKHGSDGSVFAARIHWNTRNT